MAAAETVTMMARDYVDEQSKKLIDNTFQATRLARSMRDSARKWAGGPGVNEYIVYAGSGGGGHRASRRFTNKERQTDQQLRWVPKFLQVPVVVSLPDLRVYNAPQPYKVLDILESKISNAFITMGSQLEVAMFLAGQGASYGANINGFAEIMSGGSLLGDASFDGVAYDSYGELDRTNPNWGKSIRGNCLALNNEIGWDVLEKTYTKATVGGAEPTIGYTTPLVKSSIKGKFIAAQRYQDAVEPTFGYVGFRFNRAIVIESRYCPGSEILTDDLANDYVAYTTEEETTPLTAYPTVVGETFWWFNTTDEYLHYYFSTDRIYGFGMMDFIPSSEHDMLVSRLRLAYMMACAGPRYHYQINRISVN